MPRFRVLSTLCLSALLLPLTACGGGGGSGGASGATVDLLIGDAPADDLLAFTATVASARLQRDDGTFTGNLAEDLEVEFLSLQTTLAFLAHGRVPPGTYTAVEVSFVPGSYSALSDDSRPVVVVSTADTYLAPLPAPLTVAPGQYFRFSIDLDLFASLSGSVGNGTITFSPGGSCRSDDGSSEAAIDEVKGRVVSTDVLASTLVVDAFIGRGGSVPLGRISVHVNPSTLLLDNDGGTLTEAQFFAGLGTTPLLEIHGNLAAGGTIEATRIEYEDSFGGGGGGGRVRIEGKVDDLGSGQLALRIRRIKDGEAIAGPVLAGLADPSVIDVTFDGATQFVFDSGALTDSNALAVGQEVKVRFCSFTSSPFPGCQVEIDDTPGFTAELGGHVASGSDLVVHLDPQDAAVTAGLVADGATPVALELGDAPIVLNLPGDVHLTTADLTPGLLMEPHGQLSGDPSAPVLAVERLVVRPGFLEGATLADVALAAGNLVVDGGSFVDPFGRTVTPGPLLVWVESACTIEGAASDLAELAELARTRTVTLDVRGIAGQGVDEVRAFAIRVR